MSQPGKFGPPMQPGSGSGRTLVIVMVSVGLSLFLCSGTTCGGLLFMVGRTKTTLAQVKNSIQQKVSPPVLVSPQWANNWITMEYLSRIYTDSLDAVIADKRVVERLGKSIEPVNEADALFRRTTDVSLGSAPPGAMIHETETIEYNLKGSKGEAVVTVEGSQRSNLPPGNFGGFHAKKITVKFSDGEEIDVPVPKEESEPEP
jgi:hypothetical protein